MKALLTALLLAFVGCRTVSPQVSALRDAEMLQGRDAPLFREQNVEGKKWVFAKRGVAALDSDSCVAFVELALARKRMGAWPAVKRIPLKNGLWHARKVDDYIVLDADGDIGGLIRHTILTPDAYLALDEKLAPQFQAMENAIRGTPSTSPVITAPSK